MPGSGDRAGGFFGDLWEFWQEAQERKRLDREVVLSVRKRAAGRTRAELRDLVASERERRGLAPLSELMLDLWVDRVLEGDSLGAHAKTNVEFAASVARAGLRIADILKERSSRPSEEPDPDAGEPARMLDIDWQATSGVRLDADAFSFVDKSVEQAIFSFRGIGPRRVYLVPIAGTTPPSVEVRLEGRRIGELSPEDAASVLPRLARDGGEAQPARTFALLARSTAVEPPKVHVGTGQVQVEDDETLWGRVSTRGRHYHHHCLVCGEPCDLFRERSALVARSGQRRFQGWLSGAVHRRCWDEGVARAAREGAGWQDAHLPDDEDEDE